MSNHQTIAVLKSEIEPPETLPERQAEPEYPLEALGSILGTAAADIAKVVQVPPAIAGQCVLAVAALVAQQKANVIRDGTAYPLSLFLLTVAESGDRKSAADKLALKPVYDYERELHAIYVEEMKEFRVLECEFNAQPKGGKGKGGSCPLPEPIPPVKPLLLCQEPTLEGLQKSFATGQPSQGLFNDEGGQFFGGHAMKDENQLKSIAGLSKFWDGDPIRRMRAGKDESMTLYNRRLSVHLMIQPVVAEKVLGNKLLMGQGFLPRFLMARPKSIKGTRFYNSLNPNNFKSISDFHNTLSALLSKPPIVDESGGLELESILIASDAMTRWIVFYDEVETQLAKGKDLGSISATASKIAEQALRVGGVFAVIEGSKEITLAQMSRAIILAGHMLGVVYGIAKNGELSQNEAKAYELLDWLSSYPEPVPINDISRKAPNSIRGSVGAIRKLMALLVASGFAEVASSNKRNEPDAWRVINAPA